MAKEDKNGSELFWHSRRLQSWMPGVVLILIGAIFLLRNFYHYELNNWWALFILFPAMSSFLRAYEQYQDSGRIGRGVRARLFWGLLLTALAVSFLLGLDFGLLWPAFLILGGLGILLGAL
jgi:hypothetical protein